MRYRRLGKAGIKVSEISLGAWLTFGRAVDDEITQACPRGSGLGRHVPFKPFPSE